MSADFVLDCSVTMTWLFAEEATSHTSKLLDSLETATALVPGLWFLEVANVLALAEKKRRVTLAESTRFVEDLLKLDIEVDSDASPRVFSHLLPFARAHQLTSYDAVYLDLAVRRRLPLATLDEPLRKAARKLSVKLL